MKPVSLTRLPIDEQRYGGPIPPDRRLLIEEDARSVGYPTAQSAP